MAILKNRFYFGPEGDVQPLPAQVRDANTDFSPQRFGASTRAITGTPSALNYGTKRDWPLKWPPMTGLEADALQTVEAAFVGLIRRRTFFLDTRRTNALPYDAVSAGALFGTDRWTAPSGGTLARTNTGVLHTDLARLMDGYLTLNGSGSGNTVRPTTWLPVIAGSSISFNLYVSGTGSVQPSVWFRNAAGIEFSVLTGSTVVLAAGGARTAMFTVAAGAIPAGAVSFRPGLTATTSAPTVNLAGLQVQYDDTAVRPLRLGGGGCECIVSAFNSNYYGLQQLGRDGRREYSATISEV